MIDFIRHRLPLFREYYSRESEGINKILSSFSGEVCVPARSIKIEPVRKPFNLRDFDVLPAKLSDLAYLSKHRGLRDDTLSVFLPYIQVVKPSWSGSIPFNIGLPYRVPGREGIIGFEQVNYLFKGYAKGSDKTNALWLRKISNRAKGDHLSSRCGTMIINRNNRGLRNVLLSLMQDHGWLFSAMTDIHTGFDGGVFY